MINSIYLLTAVIPGIFAMIRGEFWSGLAGTLAPCLSLIAGAGIREGMNIPDCPTAGAIGLGAIFFAVSAYWINAAEWSIRIASLELPGIVICSTGFLVGVVFYEQSNNDLRQSTAPHMAE